MMTIRHYKVESPLNSLLRLDMCQLAHSSSAPQLRQLTYAGPQMSAIVRGPSLWLTRRSAPVSPFSLSGTVTVLREMLAVY